MALFELGRIYARLGVASEAAASFQRALTINPTHAPAWHNLGNAYARLDRLDEAIAAFRQALALDEEYALAWYNLGNAHFAKGELAQARKAFTTALDHQEGYADAYHGLGGVALREGAAEEAVGHFRTVLAADSSYARAHYGLALAYRALGDSLRAVAGTGSLQAAARRTVTCDLYSAWLSSRCLAPQSRQCPIRPLARSAWPLAWRRSRRIWTPPLIPISTRRE